jgi:cell division septation protein DedD
VSVPARAEAEERVRYYWGPDKRSRPHKAWREGVLIRADELGGLISWMSTLAGCPSPPECPEPDADLDAAAHLHLTLAREAAGTYWGVHWGARMERSVGHLDAAEALVLRRSPDDYLRGELPELVAYVQAHLPPAHPERVWVQTFAAKHGPAARNPADLTPIAADDRSALVEARRTAGSAERREHTRLRSFRTTVVMTALVLTTLAVLLGYLGWQHRRLMPLCFAPQGSGTVVCPTATAPVATSPTTTAPTTTTAAAAATTTAPSTPAASTTASAATATTSSAPTTPAAAQIDEALRTTASSGDSALVMLLGVLGAAVTAAAAIRRLRGTSTAVAVPLLMLALKLPTGALTAFLGLLLLRGQFVPGLSALDDSGQILAWAVIFGAAQQLVTGLIDKTAQSRLDAAGPAPMTEAQE